MKAAGKTGWGCKRKQRLKTCISFSKGAPAFAVKVGSENDYSKWAERQMAKKRADYFAAGTKVVWDVNLLSEEVIKSYSADTT